MTVGEGGATNINISSNMCRCMYHWYSPSSLRVYDDAGLVTAIIYRVLLTGINEDTHVYVSLSDGNRTLNATVPL